MNIEDSFNAINQTNFNNKDNNYVKNNDEFSVTIKYMECLMTDVSQGTLVTEHLLPAHWTATILKEDNVLR